VRASACAERGDVKGGKMHASSSPSVAARSLQAGGLPGLRPGVQAGLQGADGWIGFVGWMVWFGWLDAPRSAGE
jgi:hypothetical protein